MITPTPGRIVWFELNGAYSAGIHQLGRVPLAAMVAYVHNERVVNLSVTDAIGLQHPRQNVRLVQEGDDTPAHGIPFCRWMPYQVGQAKKHEAADVDRLDQARGVTG